MIKKDPVVRKLAIERIERLFELAKAKTKERDSSSKQLAKRYVRIAKEISEHYKVTMPKNVKNMICKNCGNILVPGLNTKVRLASSKKYITYICECGEEKHIFYK